MSISKDLGGNLCDLLIQAGELIESTKEKLRHLDSISLGNQADLEAHHFLSDRLRLIYPVPIVSEENSESHKKYFNEYWLIDPIDGTSSYSNGYTGYVVQCCLIRNGVVLMAGVYAPHFKKIYFSIKGGGVYVDGQKLSVEKSAQEKLSIVDNEPTPHGIAGYLCSKMNIDSYVESGSLGLKLCLVAEGKASIFIKSTRVRDWDIAPASLFIEELKGKLTNINGEEFFYAPGSRLHKGLIATLNQELHQKVLVHARGYIEHEI